MTPRDVYSPPPPAPARDGGRLSRRSLLRLGASRFSRAAIDFDGVTATTRAEWEPRCGREALLRAIEPVAEVVADAAGCGPGDAVLDVGAGDGNVALECARRGAAVDACDLAAAMVERGRARSGAAVHWRRADAQALPYGDAAFDVVVSAFGAVLAPRGARTARELARVCRPGGRVVLAAWAPRGLPGRLTEFAEAIRPLPEGVRSPADWGREDVARARMEPLLDDVEVRTRTVALSFPSADALFAELVPATFDDPQRAALRPAFDRLLASCNNRPPEAVVDARYLLISGRRRS